MQYDPESILGDHLDVPGEVEAQAGDPIISDEDKAIRDWDLELIKLVAATGKTNIDEARIPVGTKWNLELLDSLLWEYDDHIIIEYLRYGWPINRDRGAGDPEPATSNHI